MYLPLNELELVLHKPRISSKSSSAVGFVVAERGRSPFASSAALAINVESGRVMPNVACIRF